MNIQLELALLSTRYSNIERVVGDMSHPIEYQGDTALV